MTKRSRSTLPTVAPADPSEQARLTQVVEKLAQEVQLLRIMMDEVQEELADVVRSGYLASSVTRNEGQPNYSTKFEEEAVRRDRECQDQLKLSHEFGNAQSSPATKRTQQRTLFG